MNPFVAKLGSLSARPSRRDWLRIGVPLALGTPLVRADSPAKPARAKSVLVIFTSGGMSQIDTLDPKPNAPEEIRGAFNTTATSLPGVRFCDLLPKVSKLANRFTVVRSITHDDTDHGSACYLALTGQFHPRKSSNPPPRPTDFPALGAVLQRVHPADRFPHAAFHVNGPLLAPKEASPGQYGGFLGRGYDPLELGDVTNGSALLEGMELLPDVPKNRLDERARLTASLDEHRYSNALVHPELTRKAYELIAAPQLQSAFDISREPAKVRDRYGRYRAGQACLLGRRLVEAGVPWVTVYFNHNIRGQDDNPNDTDEYGWDTHNDIFDAMRNHLLPRFDQSFSALMEDLEQRGLLKTTLVLCIGEFGRAPLVALEKNFAGTTPGRKHWAKCYSAIAAGAGVARGAVFGSSDRQGAYPQSNPVTPGDIAATLFNALGIDPAGHYTDLTNRPYRITTGDPIAGLFQ